MSSLGAATVEWAKLDICLYSWVISWLIDRWRFRERRIGQTFTFHFLASSSSTTTVTGTANVKGPNLTGRQEFTSFIFSTVTSKNSHSASSAHFKTPNVLTPNKSYAKFTGRSFLNREPKGKSGRIVTHAVVRVMRSLLYLSRVVARGCVGANATP